MMISVFEDVINEMKKSNDVWFAKHEELAQWARSAGTDELTYSDRYLG